MIRINLTDKKISLKVFLAINLLFAFTQDAFCWTFGELTKLKGGYLICDSKDSFDRGRSMLDDNDQEAFLKFASTGVCGITKEGTEVYVIKTHLTFHGSFEVRPKGETYILWVDSGAIRDSLTVSHE